MNIGKIVKKVVSTVKNASLEGRPLLLVQPLNMKFEPQGSEVLAIDFIGTDIGEIVLLMKEGSSVQQMLGDKNAPADAAIIGVVDTMILNDHKIFEKYPA